MKQLFRVFMALFAMFVFLDVRAEDYITTNADKALADKLMAQMHSAWRKSGGTLSTADLMVMAAQGLYGTPYVAGTLDEDPTREVPRLYLTKTDCIIFVETCLALAKAVQDANVDAPQFPAYALKVLGMRYRTKPPYSYGDRIHYTTEWIRRQKASLKDVTLDLGGEVYDHPIHFMTSNSSSYKQLADPDNVPRAALALRKIAEAEAQLAKEPMTYIPSDKVAEAASQIWSGDIICFTSSVEGLDISHVAIAFVEGGRVGFIHASQAEGKVVKDRRTIAEYVARPGSKISGIKVVRPL